MTQGPTFSGNAPTSNTLAGRKGVVMGVVNDHSIAWGIARSLHQAGAGLAFSHLPDKDDRGRMARRIRQATEGFGPLLTAPCDVSRDEDIDAFFGQVRETLGTIDFLVHSIAFADAKDLRGPTIEASREGFKLAMDVSVYSLLAVARRAALLMPDGGSILTLTYFGGERVVAGYNMMGVVKAALEQAVRYLAYDLGPARVRVNALSAGPVRTLAASAIGEFSRMMKLYDAISPLARNVSLEEIGSTASFLLGPGASGITGETVHVDSGFHVMGGPGRAEERITQG